MVQVYIPAGEFLMGSDSGEENAQPVHEVYLDGFWMDEHEVTADQFQKFMEETSHSADPKNSGNYPVAGVNIQDALSYCEWAGRRLPTEAEWEKAARGGLEGKLYPWGDEYFNNIPGDIGGAQGGNGVHDPINVQTYAPNGYGLYDMAGNIWEWTADFYDENYYSNSPENNPTGPQDGELYVVRGGSWFLWMNNLRVDHRFWSGDGPDSGGDHIGFRCVESVGSEESPVAEPLDHADFVNTLDGAVMAYVPSGDFLMGSDSGESKESPAHTVYLDGFWISKTEVTNDMYRLCVIDGTCNVNDWQTEFYNSDDFQDYPAASFSWKQADTYCKWTGGYLPTEAQWEKAARGTDGRTYPWGEGADIKYAQYASNDYYQPNPTIVGSYPEGASPYGLLDMAGNVAEYVADWYDSGYYEISPSENPLGPEDGLERVVRGGSFNSSAYNIRVTRRSSAFLREEQNNQVGFRCATSQLP